MHIAPTLGFGAACVTRSSQPEERSIEAIATRSNVVRLVERDSGQAGSPLRTRYPARPRSLRFVAIAENWGLDKRAQIHYTKLRERSRERSRSTQTITASFFGAIETD